MSPPSTATSTSSSKHLVDLPVRAGQVLEGKFRIEKIIGEGAMGLVVEATHLDLDERVALKFLRREARERPDIVARFSREARAAAKIKSDNVARVYDVGGTADGSPFIVMEFLEGSDLENVLASRGRVDVGEAVEHVVQACLGLMAAHAHGIVHRDIKPGNLFLSVRGGSRQVKLLDFGISKAGLGGTFDDIDIALANTTQIMGSPHYMSPEQIRSTRDVDARADVWSLGVVLFELLTGETPFGATDVTGIIAQVLYEPHRTVRSLVGNVPAPLEAIIDRCLEKDVDKRWQSAADLAVALLPFAPKGLRPHVERAHEASARAAGTSNVPESLPPPPLPSSTVVAGTTTGTPVSAPVAPAPSPAKKGAFVWIALACIVFGIGGGVLAMVARKPAPQSPDPALAEPATATATPATAAPPASLADPSSAPAGTSAGVVAPASSAVAHPSALPRSSKKAGPAQSASAKAAGAAALSGQPQRTTPTGENEIRLER